MNSMNKTQALAHFEKQYPQFRCYVRGDDVVVRDEDSNLVAIYKTKKTS